MEAIEEVAHAGDMPDFIEIEESDYSKYEPSGGKSESNQAGRSRLAEEVFPCDCHWPSSWIGEIEPERLETVACGGASGCINRTLFVECRPQDCPCGDHCQNQRFQRRQYKPIQVFQTPGKGHGLRCLVDLKAGDFIIEYVGEVVSQAQMQKRVEINAQLGQQHYYFMTLQSDQILDATRKGNYSRFMNHSCNPNCATQKWIVNGQVRIGLFAIRPVPAGTELTFDYKFVRFSSEAQKCLCGEPNCKGFIGTQQRKDLFDTSADEEDDEEEKAEGTEDQSYAGIDDPEVMAALAKVLLRKETAKELRPALGTLLSTKDDVCLRKFLSLHGLQIMSILLGLHRRDNELAPLILRVLLHLPAPSRNAIEEAGLEAKLNALDGDAEVTEEAKGLAAELRSAWKGIERAFTIPKASSEGTTTASTNAPSAPQAAGYSLDDGTAYRKASSWAAARTEQTEHQDTRRRETDRRDYRDWNRDGDTRPRDRTDDNRNRDRTDERRDRRYGEQRHGEQRNGERRSTERRRSRSRSPPAPSSSSSLPPGWRQALTGDGKPYYYHEKTRETRWDPPVAPPSSSSTSAPPPSALVEGLRGQDIEAIIARARAAALAASNEPAPVKPATAQRPSPQTKAIEDEAPQDLSLIRDQVSQVVVPFLSRYQAQFKDQSAFKDMARKLTHGLADKEYRSLLAAGVTPTSFHISKTKRSKMLDYLCQYLTAHGFKGVSPE